MEQRRCCNLDWLEVHCLEPVGEPRDAAFYMRQGLHVVEREYGTRVYREMFTVHSLDDRPFVEVRRAPFSVGFQGIHAAEECHLRLVNAACYYEGAAALLADFMRRYGYQFNRIVRVDICLDFIRFDSGDEPARFVRRFFAGKYRKINQGNITSHGKDTWSGQEWNSLSWGAPKSDIGTKLYDKTLELYDPKSRTYGKPHIRFAWLSCGLVSDFHTCQLRLPDGTVTTPRIWRLEFSIRSSVKKWFVLHPDGHDKVYMSVRNTLDMYDSRDKLLTMFASLQPHYFRFKYFEEGQRKDRCRDKTLFDFSGAQVTYKIDKGSDVQRILGDTRRLTKPLDSLLEKIKQYRLSHSAKEIHEACDVLIRAIEGDLLRSDMANPWSWSELLALRQALSLKDSGSTKDVAVLMREIKELLRIHDKVAVF